RDSGIRARQSVPMICHKLNHRGLEYGTVLWFPGYRGNRNVPTGSRGPDARKMAATSSSTCASVEVEGLSWVGKLDSVLLKVFVDREIDCLLTIHVEVVVRSVHVI